MANRTDVSAIKIFGSNPQYLISNIIRSKIYESPYWKEKCFALTSESIIDQAVNLKYVGGTYGGNRKPTRFLCLVLKLLQIQPDKDIIYEYIKNEEFIYLRALGIFYLRLIGKSLEIYRYLEPILFDYRKLRIRLQNGTFEKIYMDEFVDNCLVMNNFLDVDFPSLTKRQVLEDNNLLEKVNLDYYKELLNISSGNELFENQAEEGGKDSSGGSLDKGEKRRGGHNHPSSGYGSGGGGHVERGKRKERNGYWERGRRRSRDRGRDRSRDRDGDRDLSRDRDGDRNRSRDRDRDRDRSRDRSRGRSYSRERDRERTKRRENKLNEHRRHKKKRPSSEGRRSYSTSESPETRRREKKRRGARDDSDEEKGKKKERKEREGQEKERQEKVGQEKERKKKERQEKERKKKDDSDIEENKKDALSVERWNKIRKDLGMKPLK